MSHIPTAHEIETASGKYIDVSNPRVEGIVLEDIAHALSNICRYGGHCRTFYSVAEHAVFVSKRLERKGLNRNIQIAGLHHDDAEAFLGDIPRPMKPLLGGAYARMTFKMDRTIAAALELPRAAHWWLSPIHPAVKDADNWALFVEARHLLPSEGRHWWDGEQGADTWNIGDMPTRIVTPDYWYGGLPPKQAAAAFIKRHKELID